MVTLNVAVDGTYSSCWPSPTYVAGLAVDGESGHGTGGAHRRRRSGEARYGHGQRDNERRDDPRVSSMHRNGPPVPGS